MSAWTEKEWKLFLAGRLTQKLEDILLLSGDDLRVVIGKEEIEVYYMDQEEPLFASKTEDRVQDFLNYLKNRVSEKTEVLAKLGSRK